MPKSSTWTALRNPVFRQLWTASVISGTCVAAHDGAATWLMHKLTGSPLLISLMPTVASLSFFLFTLPAGILADKVDRQKLVCTINLSLAASALGLAALSWFHLLNPYLILFCVFLIGVGFAFNAPAWTSIVPQVVSDAELPSAATLSGLQLNLSGIIGPALGGVLVPLGVAAQRAMPNWARGRLNATVIMTSQGATAFGGLIWGCAAAIAGTRYALTGAAILFLASLLLTSRLHLQDDLRSNR